MNQLPTVTLIRHLAETLKADSAFNQVAQAFYDKNWLVECGFDRRRIDWTQSAPFAVFLVNGTELPQGMGSIRHSFGILLGVNDNVHEPQGASTVFELQGTTFLGEYAWPKALDAIERAVGRLPGFSLGDVSLEFSQENYPLIHLNAAITIQQSIPIGSK